MVKMAANLDPIGRGQRVELEAVLPDGQLLLVGGAGDGAVDVGELAPGLLLPLPHIRRLVSTWELHMYRLLIVYRASL